MKHLLSYFLCLVAFVFVPFKSEAQEYPFASGEKTSVIIHYKFGFSADIAQIDLNTTLVSGNGNPYYHVVANASTYKGYDGFFKVRDLYESKFYAKDLSPLYFHRDVKEGKFWAKNWYDWKQDGKQLHAIVDKRNRPHRDTTYTSDVVIRDILNLFFSGRAMDFDKLEKGRDYQTLIAMDKDILKIRLHFLAREKKKIPDLGTFKTIKVGVVVIPVTAPDKDEHAANTSLIKFDTQANSALDDGYYGEDKIVIWFSDDANKIPLYFTSPVAVGSINGRLSSYEGLKYPMTSKIK